ncbi:apolipoprotein D-like [Pecten maximus]|uniref:apolipoprotein D-like n=1 Tax=Pecten maximus TaxID=6579 RepID=UPI0014586B3A|nr:apolipoprotein D-like [Pecten maximus]
MNRLFLIVLLAPAISAFLLDTLGLDTNVQTVTELDVSKYLGRWYQMYASQSVFATFERGAVCVTADYTMSTDGSGKIIVLNSERLKNGNGSPKIIHGYATPSGEVGKLSVHLETVAFSAPYWVVQLGPATFGPNNTYEYAVVTDNFKATLFVLARDPDQFKLLHEASVLQYLNDNGFTKPLNKPISTYHGDDCLYNENHQ